MEEQRTCLTHSDVILCSRIELENCLCMACLEVKLRGLCDVEASNFDLKAKLEQATRRMSELESQNKKIRAAFNAELEGTLAASNSLPESQNPYNNDPDLFSMWLNGWNSVMTRRMAGEAMAVVRWSVDVLESIKELAAGYGNNDICPKIEFIQEKLSRFVDTED